MWNVFKRVALDMFTAIKRGDFSWLFLGTVLLQIQCLIGRFGGIDIKRDQAVDNTLADVLGNFPTSESSNDVLLGRGFEVGGDRFRLLASALDRFWWALKDAWRRDAAV